MPIIKSIGRKDTNFSQLINYLHRLDGGEQETFTYLHNIPNVAPDDMQSIAQSFQQNNQYRKKRKNGVGQYHEVLSFHPDDTEYIKQHPEIIEDLARIYLELRAPDAIAIARPHTDKDHLHLHFMISPNEIGKAKSIRLSKKEFQALRRTIEEYQLVYYPNLKSSYVQSRDELKYQSQQKAPKSTNKEHQMQKRGIGLYDKKELSSTVQAMLNSTDSFEEFSQILKDYEIEVYRYRGRIQGVKYNGRKYRFGRLLGKGSLQMKVVAQWNERQKRTEKQRELDLNIKF